MAAGEMQKVAEVRCEFYDDCREDKNKNIAFQARVMEKLENIEKYMEEKKRDNQTSDTYMWTAIESVRADIKNLYWRIGLISGGAAIVTSLATTLVMSILGKMVK